MNRNILAAVDGIMIAYATFFLILAADSLGFAPATAYLSFNFGQICVMLTLFIAIPVLFTIRWMIVRFGQDIFLRAIYFAMAEAIVGLFALAVSCTWD